MADPVIFDTKPTVLELEAGDYFWCSCGMSVNQPFCNGAHKGTEFKPIKFTLEEKKRVPLCACKYTNKPPFCDGTHKQLLTEAAAVSQKSSSLVEGKKASILTSLINQIFRKTS